MESLVSSRKLCVSIYVSGHGYKSVSKKEQTISMTTRSQSTIKYDGSIKVFQLSMAGLANVTTEMGIIYKYFTDLGINSGSKFLTQEIVDRLREHKRSTEYATLTWLVHKIYGNHSDKSDESDESDKCEKNRVRLKLEEFKDEMLVIEKLAHLVYAKFSPPTIITNPPSNKVYALKPNLSEIIRRKGDHPDGGEVRSNFVRMSGNPKHNLLWAFYGVYMLDTSDKELNERFSISKKELVDGFVSPQVVKKCNLFTPQNYYSFWKPYLNTRDFSGVPDSQVINIGDDLETSVAIFKKFCKVTGIVNSARSLKGVPNNPLVEQHIETLRRNVTVAAQTIREAIEKVKESANTVSKFRAEFQRTANLADDAEEKYTASLSKRRKTRLDSNSVEPQLHTVYDKAEADWQQASKELVEAKSNYTTVNEHAQRV